jgi:hypothetical protein
VDGQHPSVVQRLQPIDVQIFDMAHLLRGRLVWNGVTPRLNNGIVQSLVAAMSIVILLATVVSLDDYIV